MSNRDNDALSETLDDREGGVKPNKSKTDDAAAKDKDKEGAGLPRRKRRSGDDPNGHSSKTRKSKRHHRNNPQPRHAIPEARVIQEHNERVYIPEHDDDEREYLTKAIWRGVPHDVTERMRREIQQQKQQEEMKKKARKGG
jgi:hypothetical protein